MSLTPVVPDSSKRGSSADRADGNVRPHANARKHNTSVPGPDHVMQELQRCEPALHAWLAESPLNADQLVRDPVGALRAANLGMDEAVLLELEATMRMIVRKLDAADSPCCA